MMSIVIGVFVGIIGIVVGSFLNVCIYRIPRGNFFSSSRSFCPHCGATLKWYDMVPVISFLVLKGRCRNCKEKISPRYPIVESLNMICWLLVYVVYGTTWLFAIYALACSVLLVLSCIDLEIKEVPTQLLTALFVLALCVFVLSFFDSVSLTGEVWWHYLLGAVVISVPLFILMVITRGGVGGGDIKLMFVLGLLLGYKLTLVAFLFGIVIAAVVSVALMVAAGKNGKYQLPLVPFLSLGFVIAVLCGNSLIDAVFGAI